MMNEIRLVKTTCDCENDCDCSPEGYFSVNGKSGSGSYSWVLNPDSNEEEFSCVFLGFEFTAQHTNEIRKKLAFLMADFHEIVVV